MQREFIRTGASEAGTDARTSSRQVRAASSSRGFFTLGFAIAALVVGGLGLGVVEAVTPESGSKPSMADVDRALPDDRARVENTKTVTVNEAPPVLANDSASAGKVLR